MSNYIILYAKLHSYCYTHTHTPDDCTTNIGNRAANETDAYSYIWELWFLYLDYIYLIQKQIFRSPNFQDDTLNYNYSSDFLFKYVP